MFQHLLFQKQKPALPESKNSTENVAWGVASIELKFYTLDVTLFQPIMKSSIHSIVAGNMPLRTGGDITFDARKKIRDRKF